MTIDFYLAGLDFQTTSDMIINGDMEINSYWVGSGEQASFWQGSSQYYEGSYSWATYIESVSFYDALVSFEDITSGSCRRPFTISDQNDLIMYVESSDIIHVFNGISNQEKFSFSNPTSLTIRGMEVYSGDLFFSINDGFYISPPGNSWIYRLNGISSEITSIAHYASGGMAEFCFDNNGNVIAHIEGWATGSWIQRIYKFISFQGCTETYFRYDLGGAFGVDAAGEGLECGVDNTLYLHDAGQDKIIRFSNCSGNILNEYGYTSLPNALGRGFKFFEGDYCLLVQSYESSSGDTAWSHLVERWSFDYADYQQVSYLRHTGENIQLEQTSSYEINFQLYLSQGNKNIRINLLRGSGIGYHFQSNLLSVPKGQWNSYTLPFSCTFTDSQAQFELTIQGREEFLCYLDNVRISEPNYYEQDEVIQIYPIEGYKLFSNQNKSDHRTKGGALYSFKWGDYKKFEIPIEYFPNSKAQLVNEWWENDSLIYFKIFSGGVWETNTCYITNKKLPFSERQKSYTNQFNGQIKLETF